MKRTKTPKPKSHPMPSLDEIIEKYRGQNGKTEEWEGEEESEEDLDEYLIPLGLYKGAGWEEEGSEFKEEKKKKKRNK